MVEKRSLIIGEESFLQQLQCARKHQRLRNNRLTSQNMDAQQVCQICFSKAKTPKGFHNHYGATCCMSCKAFFRRCYQDAGESKADSLRCQNDGKCDLKQIKRYECKQCRLAKCLEIGMKPQMVLQGENRLKYTHRKNKKKISRPRDDGSLLQSIKDTYDQVVESIPVDSCHLSILLEGSKFSLMSLEVVKELFCFNVSSMLP